MYVKEQLEFKSIHICLINDYLLIADLHIFVYYYTEFFLISLKCIKVKLLILNNFGVDTQNTLHIDL